MIKLIQGDLFSSDADIIAHGVNCSGGFGSGIAGIIAKEYPWVREQYFQRFDGYGWQLGDVQFVYPPNGGSILPIIANVATQRKFGYDGKKYVTYTAIEEGFRKVVQFANEQGLTVAAPRIGAGLAGGSWAKILPIFVKVASEYSHVAIEIYSLEA